MLLFTRSSARCGALNSFLRGEFEVADGVSASVFSSVLDFYHTGIVNCPSHVSVAEMREACDYFLIPFTADTVQCQNLRGLLHELSNDGAEEQFETFLNELILPQMVESIISFTCPEHDQRSSPGDMRFARRSGMPHCRPRR